ncbi:MAG: SDR family NAD(P)-dependent oxidoreductase [Bacteroidota bacterium]
MAYSIAADVTKGPDRRRIISETAQRFGGIDILVNGAGVIASGTIETTSVRQ